MDALDKYSLLGGVVNSGLTVLEMIFLTGLRRIYKL